MKLMANLRFMVILWVAMQSIGQAQVLKVYNDFHDFEKDVCKKNDTTYVINFWATWCKPCIQELPLFEALQKANMASKVKIVLVSLDFKHQIESHLKPFLHQNSLQSKVVLLSDKKFNTWIDKVSTAWSGSIPATLLIKGENRLFEEKEFTSFDELQSWVGRFIHNQF